MRAKAACNRILELPLLVPEIPLRAASIVLADQPTHRHVRRSTLPGLPPAPAALGLMWIAATITPATGALPNIVLVLADDMGWSDLGCYGSEIATPNLDALARDGLRFAQFYNSARCCPTRAALLTGLYPHQAGIGDMVGNDGIPSYRGFLNDRCLTLAEALRPAGYTTLMAGKWHVGSAPGQWPLDRGFDRYWGTPSGGGVYFKETLEIRKEVFFVRDAERIEIAEDFYATDAITDQAMALVEDAVRRTRRPDPAPPEPRPEEMTRLRSPCARPRPTGRARPRRPLPR